MTTILLPALLSSIVETTITHPIDVIKIHKQTAQNTIYRFKNLYSGFIPRAAGNIPSRTIFLFSQDYLKQYFDKNNLQYQSITVPLIAGFAQTLVDTPVEVLKMNQIMKIKNNSLYTGFIPHLGRNTIFVLSVYNFRQLSQDKGYLYSALYGAIGGMIGSYISHPLDTIKTCVQTNKDYSNFKIKDYFRGCHLRASISMINMFISLFVFEFIKKY
jgi:hypothetical protein